MRRLLKALMLAGLLGLIILSGCGTTAEVSQQSGDAPVVVSDANAELMSDDFSHLRTPYVGAAHATQNIVNVLTLPGENWTVLSIQIGADHGDFYAPHSPYTLTIFYEPQQGTVIDGSLSDLKIPTAIFEENSDLLFDLIENLRAVTFSVRFNRTENGEHYADIFDYRWSRSRYGEYSLGFPLNEPALSGFRSVSGTVSSIEPFVDGTQFVLIDYVDRYCEIIDGLAVMSGTPGQINLHVDHNALLLLESPLAVGMIVTAFYEYSAQPSDAMANRAAALVCPNYGWVHVDRFDENFMSFCGSFSLAILDDAEIIFQDTSTFVGETTELTNRPLAVYVAMSASPTPDGPLIHGIGSNRIIILNEAVPRTVNPVHIKVVESRFIEIENPDFVDTFDSFHEINYNTARGNMFDSLTSDGMDGDRLLIWTDVHVRDFSLIEIAPDFAEDGQFQIIVQNVLYTLPELTQDKPIILNSYFGVGTFPHSGIVFTDVNGTRRYFSIVQNQNDYGDPYLLREFVPFLGNL